MEIPVQTEAWRERVMQDGGVIPGTGFLHVGDKEKRGATCTDNSSTVQARASHTSHMHSFSEGRLGGYTFEACVFRADQV